MTTAAAEPGLRERKKATTRQALHEAAIRLAIEQGPDKVTVEAIADEAGVSRRTFSNYFANKEEALLHGDQQRISMLLELVRDRPAAEPAWTALTAAARDFYRQLGELDPELVTRSRMVRSHPALVSQQIATFAAAERELAASITDRLATPSALRARLTAAVFLATLRVSLNVWLDNPAGPPLADLVTEALAEAGDGLA